MGLVENVLLKGLLLLDTGIGVVIVLMGGKETGLGHYSCKPRMISDCSTQGRKGIRRESLQRQGMGVSDGRKRGRDGGKEGGGRERRERGGKGRKEGREKKNACCQASQPESDPQSPPGRGREPTPESCSLTFSNKHTHTPTKEINVWGTVL